MTDEDKIHLGDGVYMQIDKWDGVVLSTRCGIANTNRIVLEREVYGAMVTAYARHALERAQQHTKRRGGA